MHAQVAKAMAEAVNATLEKFGEARPEELAGYDLVGMRNTIRNCGRDESS